MSLRLQLALTCLACLLALSLAYAPTRASAAPAPAFERVVAAPDGSLLFLHQTEVWQRDGSGDLRRLPIRAALLAYAGQRRYRWHEGRLFLQTEPGATEQELKIPAEIDALSDISIGPEAIFLAEASRDRVWCLDAHGGLLGQIDNLHTPPGLVPMQATAEGRLLLAHSGRHRVQVHAADGSLLATHGGSSRGIDGYGGCCNPIGLLSLADGTYLTLEQRPLRLRRHDAAGRPGAIVALPPGLQASAEADAACATDCDGYTGLQPLLSSDGRLFLVGGLPLGVHELGRLNELLTSAPGAPPPF